MQITETSGVSEPARFVTAQLEAVRRHSHATSLSGVESFIRGELPDLWNECSVDDWDGYDAFAITPNAYACAIQFLRSLPLGMPLPELGAEPDGSITMEWHDRDFQRLSISVSSDGFIHYAALMLTGRSSGTEFFDREVSGEIALLLAQLRSSGIIEPEASNRSCKSKLRSSHSTKEP